MTNKLLIPLVALFITLGCTSLVRNQGRLFLDSTYHKDSPPEWVLTDKIGWDGTNSHFIRSSHTIRGDERINGCYDLARLDAKEALLTEIADDIKGRIDNAQQSLSEAAEAVLGKVRSGEYKGRITGLKFRHQYFERYLVSETERIDCHVLSEISLKDYNYVKGNVLGSLSQAEGIDDSKYLPQVLRRGLCGKGIVWIAG